MTQAPDTTSVRSLVTSVTALARHLDVTPNTIYQWIAINRIPGARIIKVANFYDIEIPMHLAGSDEKRRPSANKKPKDTLPTCLKVQAGDLTVDQAAEQLGIHKRAVQLILKNWGDQLPLLHKTLCQLEDKEISLDQAALALQVSKYNVHVLRQKYGFNPEPRQKAKPRPIHERRKKVREIALKAIEGDIALVDVDKKYDVSWRTVHRDIAKISPDLSLIDLTHWPKSFRKAYAEELQQDSGKQTKVFWEFAEKLRIPLKKWPKYPKPPTDWRTATAKTMMIHVLLGDISLQELAESRGADPKILSGIFTGDLRPIHLTWEEVMDAPIRMQIALAELLLAFEASRKTPRTKMIEKLAEEKQ